MKIPIRPPRRNRRTRLGAVACGLASVTILSACGASGAGTDDPLKVIVSTQRDVTMMGPEAAEYLNLWSTCSKNLNVEITAGQEVPQAIASGSVDVGLTSPNGFIAATSKGLPAKIIGASMPLWDQYAIVSNESPATDFKALKGSTFGISSFGSAGHYATVALANSLGWSKGAYKVVTLGGLNGLKAGLKSGTIDAFLWSGAPAFTLQTKGVARVLGSVSELVGPNAMTVYGVSQQALDARPEDVRALMDCSYKAIEQLQNNPAQARKMLIDWGYLPAVADKLVEVEIPQLSTTGKITDEMLKGMLDATHATIKGSKSITIQNARDAYRPWSTLGSSSKQ